MSSKFSPILAKDTYIEPQNRYLNITKVLEREINRISVYTYFCISISYLKIKLPLKWS